MPIATFEGQRELSNLPVPPLEQTISKYLTTIEPFLDREDYEKTVALATEFKDGVGQVLHQRLLDRADKCLEFNSRTWEPSYPHDSNSFERSAEDEQVPVSTSSAIEPTRSSWLIDWWNQYSYLRYREPVVLNVSFFFVFPYNYGSMISRAAQICYHAAMFKQLLVAEQLPPDMNKDKPMCMQQYKFLFNTCRVPKPVADIVHSYDPKKNHHIVVIRNNQFYQFSLKQSAEGLISVENIEKNLLWIIQDADKKSQNDAADNIGMLTADNRDAWAVNYKHLSRENADFLTVVESSSFVLCLDSSTPITREEMSHLCWHGYGNNRWFDKTLQFIVFQNGRAGFLGEHSMTDATTPARLCEYICENANSHKKIENATVLAVADLQDTPKHVPVKLDSKLKQDIERINKKLFSEISNHDVQVVNYTRYGKGFIKKQSLSPDSFVQMAIQLAYFRLMGTFVATYESAGMRKYQWGRTETCRSVSNESVDFCKAMEDFEMDVQQKKKFARDAIQAHSAYMASCLQGSGIDRHFLGLRLSLKADEPMPAFFLDPVYNLSCHWTLSTSQIPSNFFEGYGWGEVVPDGFGVAYMVREDRLMLNVAGLRGAIVPDLDHHFSSDKVVDTSHIPTEQLRELKLTSNHSKKQRDVHKSYFANNYKPMRVKWMKACLEEAFDDLYQLFSTPEPQTTVISSPVDIQQEKPRKSSTSSKASSIQGFGEGLRMTTASSSPQNAPLKPVPSNSNLGLSLAYPSRQELDGVVGEDVGCIEFEIGWGEQRQKHPDATSSYSRRKKLVKMLNWWNNGESTDDSKQ